MSATWLLLSIYTLEKKYNATGMSKLNLKFFKICKHKHFHAAKQPKSAGLLKRAQMLCQVSCLNSSVNTKSSR